jgi:hypothetical protein
VGEECKGNRTVAEIGKAYRTKLRLFVGAFHDAAGVATTSVRWSTRAVSLSDGPVEGRLRVTPRTAYGIGEAVSAVPPRAQATLELLNGDGALTRYVIGTTGGAAQEYRGDSFLNLKGQLFAVYLLADGTEERHAITPTLTCSGSPTITEGAIVVPMAADDSKILGKPAPVVRVHQLREAVRLADPGTCFGIVTGEAMTAPEWGDVQNDARSTDTAIPYAYGRVAIPLTPVGDEEGQHLAVYVSKHEPTISDAKRWQVWRGIKSSESLFRFNPDWQPRLWSAKIRITDEDDATHDLWIVMLSNADSGRWKMADTFALAPVRNTLSAGPGRQMPTPPAIARWIVEDLSETGTAAIHGASFNAAQSALLLPDACGGLVTGDATIGETLTHIGAPWALSWWIGLDDKLHVGVPGQWTAADSAALTSADTPRIHYPRDFASGTDPGGYQETIPAEAEARGSAVRKVSLEWHEIQRRAWPADEMPRWSPGATELPVQSSDEARLSAAWLYPPSATYVLASAGARRVFPTRRVTLHVHDWIGVLERQAIVLLTYPLGGAGAYTDRALRLERTADDPREYVVATFEDLGPTAAAKPARYDTIANWDSVVGGASLTVSGTDVTASAPVFDPEKHVGMHLHTPGAAAANRAIARRITAVADTTHAEVEFAFPVGETIAASPGGTPVLDCAWAILESFETHPTTAYLCAADESTGTFRDGVTPGFTVGAA